MVLFSPNSSFSVRDLKSERPAKLECTPCAVSCCCCCCCCLLLLLPAVAALVVDLDEKSCFRALLRALGIVYPEVGLKT